MAGAGVPVLARGVAWTWRRGWLPKTILALSSYFGVLTLAHSTPIIRWTGFTFSPVSDVLTPQAPGLLPCAFSADGPRRANAFADACVEDDALPVTWELRAAASSIVFIAEDCKRTIRGGAAPAWHAANATDAATAIE